METVIILGFGVIVLIGVGEVLRRRFFADMYRLLVWYEAYKAKRLRMKYKK